MQWLNLQISIIRHPHYVGAEPVARATWLNVLCYSVEQENGGRIPGAAKWKDRQWQQTCGVTAAEVAGAGPLVAIDGDDVVVFSFPSEKQSQVQAKRTAGAAGGRAKAANMRRASSTPDSTTLAKNLAPASIPSSTPLASSLAPASNSPTEGEGEGEGEGKEKGRRREVRSGPGRPATGARAMAPTLEQWSTFASQLDPNWPSEDVGGSFDHYSARGWKTKGGDPVSDWQACVRICHRRWRRTFSEKSPGGGAAAREPFNPRAEHAYTGGVPVV